MIKIKTLNSKYCWYIFFTYSSIYLPVTFWRCKWRTLCSHKHSLWEVLTRKILFTVNVCARARTHNSWAIMRCEASAADTWMAYLRSRLFLFHWKWLSECHPLQERGCAPSATVRTRSVCAMIGERCSCVRAAAMLCVICRRVMSGCKHVRMIWPLRAINSNYTALTFSHRLESGIGLWF